MYGTYKITQKNMQFFIIFFFILIFFKFFWILDVFKKRLGNRSQSETKNRIDFQSILKSLMRAKRKCALCFSSYLIPMYITIITRNF